MFKFLLFLTYGLNFVKSEYCNYHGNVHEVRTQNEVDLLENCSSINGSLFINGEFNINNLNSLSNLKNISGYLLIWNSHNLTNLMGLHNLDNINGDNLYLNNYFSYIVDNHNLCFVNTIDWSQFNQVDSFRTAINGYGCPSCDGLCNGCWNSELCQNCRYYKSGTICVEQCPVGTDIEGNICIEFIPFPPENLEINSLNYTQKNITWNPPTFPNGVILGYNFYLDQNLIYTGLNTFYVLSDLNLNQNYDIKVNVFNSEGNSSNTSLILSIGDGLPQIPFNIRYQIINQSVQFTWLSDGEQYFYQIYNFSSNYSLNNQLILDNLNYYSNYSIRIKSSNIYGESNFSDWINFTSYEYYPKTPNPADLSLNNLSLNIKFNPKYPLNGRILNYNFRIYQNNNLYLNQSTHLNNINITTNYYKDYEVNYNLTNNIGISQSSNSSYITTPIGPPLKPAVPVLTYTDNLIVSINNETDINGPIIIYQILMFISNNITVIYNNQFPGNITLYNLNRDKVYEFQSRVFTSDNLYSESEKISYNPILENNNIILPWWIILIIVVSCLLLFSIGYACTSHLHKKHLNKVADSMVLNQNQGPTRRMAFERINPAYEPGLPDIRRSPNALYGQTLNRRRSDSHFYSEIDRDAINNPNYESLYTPSNPPDISIPKNMLRS